MNTELRPLVEIKLYDNNPRVNDPAVDAVAESIRVLVFGACASHHEDVVRGFHLRVMNVPARFRGSHALPEAKSRGESQGPANGALVRVTREPRTNRRSGRALLSNRFQ